jgi:hypothetical protein
MIEYGREIEPYLPEGDSLVPFVCREIAGVNVRILGPETLWGGEISVVSLDTSELQEILNQTGKRTGLRLAGYISQQEGGLNYHMARLPRRVNLEVPPLETFQQAFDAVQHTLSNDGIDYKSREEQAVLEPQLRVLLGLEEGYFESRRKDLVRQIGEMIFSNVDQVREAFELRIGDPLPWKIDFQNWTSIEDAKQNLEAVSMSKLHTFEEIRSMLPSEFEVNQCLIHSVAPDYIYVEPAVEIIAPRTQMNFETLTVLAAQFHQARFSLEHLDTMEAFNVEILEDSASNAARYG